MIDKPALRGKKILHFYGTHEGRKWDHVVTRFVFHSEHNIELSNMRKVLSVKIEDARIAHVVAKKSVIENSIGQDIGDLKGEMVTYDLVDDNHQIKIHVIESTKGFYIEVQNLEK